MDISISAAGKIVKDLAKLFAALDLVVAQSEKI